MEFCKNPNFLPQNFNLWKCEISSNSRTAMESGDSIGCLRTMCYAVCWYSCFPRRLSFASISLAYTIFPAYLAFLSKTKINEYFSFREIEANEISVRFRVFFGAIARMRSDSNKSFVRDCWWRDWDSSVVLCRHKEQRETQRSERELCRLSTALPAFPSFPAHQFNGCDIFPT